MTLSGPFTHAKAARQRARRAPYARAARRLLVCKAACRAPDTCPAGRWCQESARGPRCEPRPTHCVRAGCVTAAQVAAGRALRAAGGQRSEDSGQLHSTAKRATASAGQHLAKHGVLVVKGVEVHAGGDVELRGVQVLPAACAARRLRPGCALARRPGWPGARCAASGRGAYWPCRARPCACGTGAAESRPRRSAPAART